MGKSLFNTRINPKLLTFIEKNQKIPAKILEEVKLHARTLKNASESQKNLFLENIKSIQKAKMPIKPSSPVTGVQRPATSVREQALESFKGWKPTVIKGGKDKLATGGIANHFRIKKSAGGIGERVGFEPGGHVTSQELKKVMANAGITPSHSNFSKVVKDLGVKVEKASTQPIYIEPTKKELIIKKKKWDENQLKSSFASKTGKAAFEKRKARIIDLILEGELTQQEIENTLRSETGLASKKTIQNVKEELGVKIVSGRERGPKNPKTAKIITDLNILKNNKALNTLILKPDFNHFEDLLELKKIATEALPKTTADPVRRVGQLLLAYSGEDPELQKYVGKISDDLVKGTGVVKTKMTKSSRFLSTLQKIAAEKTAAGELGKDLGFFGSQRKRLGEIVNSLKKGLGIEVDEVKAIGGARAKTPAYNLFIQGIKGSVNQRKGDTLDKATQTAELNLQKATTKAKKIKIAEIYNEKVKKFVANANKNLKPGQLPIRAFEISFDPPSETIKNKAAYNKYKSYFDDVYTKHGYSFKVPKDIMTSEQARTFLKTEKGKAQLLKQVDLGSSRMYSFPANLSESKALQKAAAIGGKSLKVLGALGAAAAPLDMIPIMQARNLGIKDSGKVGLTNLAEDYGNLPGLVWEAGEWVASKAKGKEHEWKTPYELDFGKRATVKGLRETSTKDIIQTITDQWRSIGPSGLRFGHGLLPQENEEALNARIQNALKKKEWADSLSKDDPLVAEEIKEKVEVKDEWLNRGGLTGVDQYIINRGI